MAGPAKKYVFYENTEKAKRRFLTQRLIYYLGSLFHYIVVLFLNFQAIVLIAVQVLDAGLATKY